MDTPQSTHTELFERLSEGSSEQSASLRVQDREWAGKTMCSEGAQSVSKNLMACVHIGFQALPLAVRNSSERHLRSDERSLWFSLGRE